MKTNRGRKCDRTAEGHIKNKSCLNEEKKNTGDLMNQLQVLPSGTRRRTATWSSSTAAAATIAAIATHRAAAAAAAAALFYAYKYRSFIPGTLVPGIMYQMLCRAAVRGALLHFFLLKKWFWALLVRIISSLTIKTMQNVKPINGKKANQWVGVLLLYRLMNT